MAVRNAAGRRRWSRLDEWLRNLAAVKRAKGASSDERPRAPAPRDGLQASLLA